MVTHVARTYQHCGSTCFIPTYHFYPFFSFLYTAFLWGQKGFLPVTPSAACPPSLRSPGDDQKWTFWKLEWFIFFGGGVSSFSKGFLNMFDKQNLSKTEEKPKKTLETQKHLNPQNPLKPPHPLDRFLPIYPTGCTSMAWLSAAKSAVALELSLSICSRRSCLRVGWQSACLLG